MTTEQDITSSQDFAWLLNGFVLRVHGVTHALVLSSDEWARANGKAPLATILAQAQIADDFAYLARTPAKAAMQGSIGIMISATA